MIYRKPLWAIIFVAVIILITGVAYSVAPPPELYKTDVPIEIDADRMTHDRKTDTYVAEGNVVAVQDKTTLYADKVVLNMKERFLIASGNLKAIDEGGNVLRGSRLELNIDEKTALLIEGKLFFKEGNFHIESARVEKTGKESYRSGPASFTTCDCDEGEAPDWKFSTTSSKVTLGQYYTGRNAVFYIRDIPLLYAPYIRVPVNRQRQSGFLPPGLAESDLRGIQVDTKFYWAISDHFDASFNVDVQTNRGIGGGVEVRGYRNKDSYLEMIGEYFREEDLDRVRTFRSGIENNSRPHSADKNRWKGALILRDNMAPGVRLNANIFMVSDDEYMLDFSDDSDERSMEKSSSSVSLTVNKGPYSLVTDFRWYDDLLVESDDMIFHKLPEITFTTLQRRVPFTPIHVSINATAVNFMREEGTDGQRYDVAPTVSLPLFPLGLVELTPSFTPRFTVYHLNEPEAGAPTNWDRHPDRFIYEAKLDAVTTLVKDYPAKGGRSAALRHTLRPRVIYRFIPDVPQKSMPDFDALDMIEHKNEIVYSINTTISGVKDGHARHELLYLDVSQSFNIFEERRELTGPGDKRRPLGDVMATFILSPMEGVTLEGIASFDVYHTRYNEYDTTLTVSDNKGSDISASYRYSRETASTYFEVATRVRLNDPLYLHFNKRYRVDEKRSLETLYGLEYRSQCWNVKLSLLERPDEDVVLLDIGFKTLGEIVGIEAGD